MPSQFPITELSFGTGLSILLLVRKTIPSLLFGLALAADGLLWWFFPSTPGLPSALRWLAVPVFLAACWFPLDGAWRFRRSRTTVFAYSEPNALVTNGAYRLTRNPMYLGMLLILVALALGVNRWTLWIPLFLFVPAMNRIVIRWEERTLASKWPEDFQKWAAQTPRWLLIR